MALIFPRLMPTGFASAQVFEPEGGDLLTGTAAGRLYGIGLGAPLWRARWALGRLSPAKSEEVRAWITAQRGSRRPFYGYDQHRPLPRLHPGGWSTGNGQAASWSVNADRDVLQMGGVDGLALSRGDYVGFAWGADLEKRALVRLVADADVSSGGALEATVEPPVPVVTPNGAIAYVNGPTCRMRLTPDTQIGDSGPLGVITGTIEAVQELVA